MGSQKKGVSPVDCNLFQKLSASFMPSLVNGVSAVGEGKNGVSGVVTKRFWGDSFPILDGGFFAESHLC